MKFTKLQARRDYRIASYTGPHSDGVCVCLVVGFGNNSFWLNSHQRDLLAFSIPALGRAGSLLEMYARTDRSGSSEYNMALSKRRLRATQDSLLSLGAPHEKAFSDLSKALGENFEAFIGQAEETRYAGGRAVWLFFWPSRAAFDEGPDDDGETSFRTLVQFGRGFTPG
jgi:hypothetical protein